MYMAQPTIGNAWIPFVFQWKKNFFYQIVYSLKPESNDKLSFHRFGTEKVLIFLKNRYTYFQNFLAHMCQWEFQNLVTVTMKTTGLFKSELCRLCQERMFLQFWDVVCCRYRLTEHKKSTSKKNVFHQLASLFPYSELQKYNFFLSIFFMIALRLMLFFFHH